MLGYIVICHWEIFVIRLILFEHKIIFSCCRIAVNLVEASKNFKNVALTVGKNSQAVLNLRMMHVTNVQKRFGTYL